MKKNTKVKSGGLKIAVLAFGSLLQPANRKNLSIVGNKFNSDGPEIPLEFTRISRKDGQLKAVIDEKDGAPNKVCYAISKHGSIDKAFDELVKSEKIRPDFVSVVDIKNKQTSEAAVRHSNTTMKIANWAKKNKIDVVLWNSLGKRFKDAIDIKFTPANAVSYLAKLPAKERDAAIKHIKSLPIKTPVTDLIDKEF